MTTNDGLSQNSVNKTLQDRDGYIWLGTQDGLNRYDGYKFEVFRPDVTDSFSISDNFIINMLEDPLGRIWISTRSGLNIFDKSTNRFYKILEHDVEYHQVNSIQTDGKSMIWLKAGLDYNKLRSIPINFSFTQAVTLLSSMEYKDYRVSKDYFNFLFQEDVLWVFENDTALNLLNSEKIHFQSDWQQNPVLRYTFINDSTALLPLEDELATFNIYTGVKGVLGINKSYLTVEKSSDINQYFAGNINGVSLVDILNGKSTQLELNEVGVSSALIQDIFLDREGLYWIGTANQGVIIYEPNWGKFKLDPPSKHIVWDALEFENKIWLATQEGISVFSSEKNYNVANYLIEHKVTAIDKDVNDNLWAGTSEGLVFIKLKERKKFEIYNYKSPKGNAISDFIIDSKGNFWIGSHSDLVQLKPDGTIVSFDSITGYTYYVLDLFEDKTGNIWIGNHDGFFCYTSKEKLVHFPFKKGDSSSINFNFASAFQEDSNGQIWVATYGGGVSRLNNDSTFTHFTEREGLSNNVIHDMLIDSQDQLWMVSNGGLSVFNIAYEEFKNFDKSDGLGSHNFALGGANIFENGVMTFCTVNGLLKFNPSEVQLNRASPILHFEDLLINYMPDSDHPELAKGRLDLYDQDRVVSLGYTALHYQNPQDVGFQYKLIGFDDNWVQSDSRVRKIVYSSLPYGEFRLQLRAFSINNHFEEVIKELRIKVHPPFWWTWWFISLMVALGLLIIASLVYYFSRRNLKRRLVELETRERIQQEREKISRDLHDSVGTHFAYIISRLDYLYLGWNTDHILDKKDYLGNISDFARSGMKMLRETIWAMSQESVSSESLKLKIDDYLRLCFAGVPVEYRFNFHLDSDAVNATQALNVFRIIQEGVSNSLKHSEAKKIEVDLLIKEGTLQIIISDDGKGFDVDTVKHLNDHYGLSNLEKRAKEMGGKLTLSSDSKGTKVIVVVQNYP